MQGSLSEKFLGTEAAPPAKLTQAIMEAVERATLAPHGSDEEKEAAAEWSRLVSEGLTDPVQRVAAAVNFRKLMCDFAEHSPSIYRGQSSQIIKQSNAIINNNAAALPNPEQIILALRETIFVGWDQKTAAIFLDNIKKLSFAEQRAQAARDVLVCCCDSDMSDMKAMAADILLEELEFLLNHGKTITMTDLLNFKGAPSIRHEEPDSSDLLAMADYVVKYHVGSDQEERAANVWARCIDSWPNDYTRVTSAVCILRFLSGSEYKNGFLYKTAKEKLDQLKEICPEACDHIKDWGQKLDF